MTCRTATSWRRAWLRGLAAGPEGPHALVLISADQYLRVPLDEEDLARWRSTLDRPVWVDLAARPFSMQHDGPLPREAGHA